MIDVRDIPLELEVDEPILLDISSDDNIDVNLDSQIVVREITIEPVYGDYDELTNKPCINEHELRGGENTLEEIGIALSSITAINRLFT